MAQTETGTYIPNSAISTKAEGLANERFEIAQDYATQTFDEAIDLLNELGTTATSLAAIGAEIDINQETLNLGALLASSKPVMGVLPGFSGLVAPIPPAVPDIDIADLKSIPAYDVAIPVFDIPAPPSIVEPVDPGDAPNLEAINSPVPPDTDLPDVPTFTQVILPADPEISIPDFDEDAPVDDIQLPLKLTEYNPAEEEPYESELLSSLTAYINDGINDPGTGISATIEGDMYERERERRDTLLIESKENLNSEWADKGAPLPPGPLLSASLALTISHDQDRLDRAREITIQQVELAQKFIFFCVEKGLQHEDIMIKLFNDVLNRAFEVARHVNEVAMLYFSAQVTLFNARLDRYKSLALIYETRIKAALIELDIYKGKLEGAKIQLEANSEEVRLYVAQVQGVEALIRLYQAEIENAKTQAELNRLNLDGYKTKVDAYTSKIGSMTARYQMYEAQIRGEATKAQTYATQVDAYKTRVEAAKIEEDLNIERGRVEGEILQRKVSLYEADITKYRAEVDARSTETTAIIEEFRGEVQSYLADSQAANVLIQSEINQFNARVAQSNNTAQLALKEAEVNIREAIETNALKIDSIKAAAQISAQIGASALSGVNASAQLSASSRVSGSVSQSYSESYGVNKDIT
jgi:hypothetical protein